jgi:hypothetical protein
MESENDLEDHFPKMHSKCPVSARKEVSIKELHIEANSKKRGWHHQIHMEKSILG